MLSHDIVGIQQWILVLVLVISSDYRNGQNAFYNHKHQNTHCHVYIQLLNIYQGSKL